MANSTHKTQPSYYVTLAAACCIALLPPAGQATIIIPVASIQVLRNSCSSWEITQTYTATPADDTLLQQLVPHGSYSYEDHFHVGTTPGGGAWSTEYNMTGTPQQKLSQINKAVFGTPTPQVGQTYTFTNAHDGSCAADQNLRECVGIFVHPFRVDEWSREPTTFPSGFCIGVPPVGVSCAFDTSSASVDLGSGAGGTRRGSVEVTASCTADTDFRVSLVDNGISIEHGIFNLGLTVNGMNVPAIVTGRQGRQALNLEVTATVDEAGPKKTSRILRIDIP